MVVGLDIFVSAGLDGRWFESDDDGGARWREVSLPWSHGSIYFPEAQKLPKAWYRAPTNPFAGITVELHRVKICRDILLW
jgi:hypothetical protein